VARVVVARFFSLRWLVLAFGQLLLTAKRFEIRVPALRCKTRVFTTNGKLRLAIAKANSKLAAQLPLPACQRWCCDAVVDKRRRGRREQRGEEKMLVIDKSVARTLASEQL